MTERDPFLEHGNDDKDDGDDGVGFTNPLQP